MATILICGHRSYAAKGLDKILKSEGHEVLFFSRGELKRTANTITGPVLEIDNNPYFCEKVDVVINFILLQHCGVEANEQYMKSLLKFCETRGVNRLIQISSISSYPNDASIISESTPIEKDIKAKGPYGSIKAVADIVLEQAKPNASFDIVLVRPGYVVASDNPHKFKGVAKFLTKNLAVLIGDKLSTLPCIRREKLHSCIAEIAVQPVPLDVYLLIEDGENTKSSYFRSQSSATLIPLPRRLIFFVVDMAANIHMLSRKTALTIKGVFKINKFDNDQTRTKLRSL